VAKKKKLLPLLKRLLLKLPRWKPLPLLKLPLLKLPRWKLLPLKLLPLKLLLLKLLLLKLLLLPSNSGSGRRTGLLAGFFMPANYACKKRSIRVIASAS
jgi:hypothetical protein